MFTWNYHQLQDGGERWNLVEHREDYDLPVVTLVRLPGTYIRAYYRDDPSTDHATFRAALTAVRQKHGEDVPPLPTVADALL